MLTASPAHRAAPTRGPVLTTLCLPSQENIEVAFDDLEPATDDSVSAVDQASHQSLVGVPARPWAGLLSPFPFLFLSRTLPV